VVDEGSVRREIVMAVTTQTQRPQRARQPSVAARRFGYVVAVLVNATMLYLVNVWPGWDAVPFITDEMTAVLGLVNASILVGIAANLVYVVNDTKSVRGLGELITTAVGLVAMIRIWQVYPFDFAGYSFDWDVVVRVLLVLGMVGSVIGLVAKLVSLRADTHSRR
jgi:hypothetical protein